jgi:hypothetical protein
MYAAVGAVVVTGVPPEPATPPSILDALEKTIEQQFRPFVNSTRALARLLSERAAGLR